jgi:hypothetical protein
MHPISQSHFIRLWRLSVSADQDCFPFQAGEVRMGHDAEALSLEPLYFFVIMDDISEAV